MKLSQIPQEFKREAYQNFPNQTKPVAVSLQIFNKLELLSEIKESSKTNDLYIKVKENKNLPNTMTITKPSELHDLADEKIKQYPEILKDNSSYFPNRKEIQCNKMGECEGCYDELCYGYSCESCVDNHENYFNYTKKAEVKSQDGRIVYAKYVCYDCGDEKYYSKRIKQKPEVNIKKKIDQCQTDFEKINQIIQNKDITNNLIRIHKTFHDFVNATLKIQLSSQEGIVYNILERRQTENPYYHIIDEAINRLKESDKSLVTMLGNVLDNGSFSRFVNFLENCTHEEIENYLFNQKEVAKNAL